MTQIGLPDVLNVFADILQKGVEEDPATRASLKGACDAMLRWIERVEQAEASKAIAAPLPAPMAAPLVAAASPEKAVPIEKGAREAVPLRLGAEVTMVPVSGSVEEVRAAATATRLKNGFETGLDVSSISRTRPESADLSTVARRCELKAESCRWAIERRRRLAAADRSGSETDASLFARAKALPNCYLWMMDPRGPTLPSDALLEACGGCYAAVGDIASLLELLAGSGTNEDEGLLDEALPLLAEAQSALRVALLDVYAGLCDTDQREMFTWLRRQTADRGVYVQRYMRMDDAADPENWADVLRRVAMLRASRDQRTQRAKARQALLGKARYHANRIGMNGDDAPSGPTEDWRKLVAALEDLIANGVPPSDLEIREVLLPVQDDLPAMDLGPGMKAILTEIDRYLGSSTREASRPRSRAAGPEVRQVREMLAGRTVILIGGENRPHAKAALEQAFDLAELVWVSTESHQSTAPFEPVVARPGTAVVLLAIRWSSHSFGDVKAMCDRYGKPFVRLPAGYNPEQVARQIVQQVSQALMPAG